MEAGRQDRVCSIQVRDGSGLALGAEVEVVKRGWIRDLF